MLVVVVAAEPEVACCALRQETAAHAVAEARHSHSDWLHSHTLPQRSAAEICAAIDTLV